MWKKITVTVLIVIHTSFLGWFGMQFIDSNRFEVQVLNGFQAPTFVVLDKKTGKKTIVSGLYEFEVEKCKGNNGDAIEYN